MINTQKASEANTPRSYIVNTPGGQLRRNRRHLTSSVDQTPDACVTRPAQLVEKPEDATTDVTKETRRPVFLRNQRIQEQL